MIVLFVVVVVEDFVFVVGIMDLFEFFGNFDNCCVLVDFFVGVIGLVVYW